MGFKLKLFLFFTLLSMSIYGQNMDSLTRVLEKMPEGESRVDVLNTIVTKLREGNVHSAVKLGTEARNLAEILDYKKGLGLAMENLGWIYYRRGIYSNAFDLSQQALKISEELGDSLSMARCLNNVGAISYEKARFEEAIEHFRRASTIAENKGDIETVIRSLNNVSFSYLGLKNTDSARFYANHALERSKLSRQAYLPAFSFRILGDIAMESGNLSLALKHYTECMRISEETSNYFIQASTLHRIGKLYFNQKNYTMALDVLNRNVKLAMTNGYADELERTYKLISEINSSRNNVDQAFEYLRKHMEIHDSLMSQRNNEQLALLSAQFESELKQSQIELLMQNALVKEEELESQKAWNYFYIGFFVLGLFIAVILYYSNLRIKKVNHALKEKTEQVVKQANQLSDINATKDKLLSIISHDIRSPLSSLRGMLNIAQTGNLSKEEFGALTTKLGSQLDSLYDDLGTLLQWTQSQLQGLSVNPEKFDLKSITGEIVQLFENTARNKKVVLKNEIYESIDVVADINHIRLALRNLISNAIKFSSEGGDVKIRYTVIGNMVSVSVNDTGIGISKEEKTKLFNTSAPFSKSGTANEKGMGVGLLLTKEFIEKNGGVVRVESELGQGSVFTFTLRKAV